MLAAMQLYFAEGSVGMEELLSTNIRTIYNRYYNMNKLKEKPPHRTRNGLPARDEVKGNKKSCG